MDIDGHFKWRRVSQRAKMYVLEKWRQRSYNKNGYTFHFCGGVGIIPFKIIIYNCSVSVIPAAKFTNIKMKSNGRNKIR